MGNSRPKGQSVSDKKLKVFRGERLRQALAWRGETSADLAKGAGVDEGQISRYINGRSEPSIQALVQMASYLNVSLYWLLGQADDPVVYTSGNKQLTEREYELLALVSRMDDKALDTLLALIRHLGGGG